MMMNKITTIFAVALFFLAAGPTMADVTGNVPGTACPYFAGQVYPIEGVPWPYADIIYDTTIPPYVDVSGFGGTNLSITATGTWGHSVYTTSGPEGYGSAWTDPVYEAFGISVLYNAPYNALVGVFLAYLFPSTPRGRKTRLGLWRRNPSDPQPGVVAQGQTFYRLPVPMFLHAATGTIRRRCMLLLRGPGF